MANEHIISVDLRRIKDWYVGTSKSLPGLFVTDPSYDEAYKSIPGVIKQLFMINDGLDVTVEEYSPENLDETSVKSVAFLARAA